MTSFTVSENLFLCPVGQREGREREGLIKFLRLFTSFTVSEDFRGERAWATIEVID